MSDALKDKGSIAIGGGVMLGIGAGFFFLTINIMWFVGCIMMGIGLGLLLSAFIPSRN